MQADENNPKNLASILIRSNGEDVRGDRRNGSKWKASWFYKIRKKIGVIKPTEKIQNSHII
jgi:hypothetical protein